MPDARACLPGDWQEQLVDMVRGARPVDASWIVGGPVCSPEQQVDIYVSQYRIRLYDALVVEIPGTVGLLGDGEETERLLRHYLEEVPSASWTLNRVADRFAPWLAAQPDVDEAVVEMARLDRAVQRGFDAAAGRRLEPEQLLSFPALELQPHVSLLRLSWNVHDLRSALLTDADIPAQSRGDFPVVVFRVDRRMKHWQMPLGAWLILESLGRGESLDVALSALVERAGFAQDDVEHHIESWFQHIAERQLVQVTNRASS